MPTLRVRWLAVASSCCFTILLIVIIQTTGIGIGKNRTYTSQKPERTPDTSLEPLKLTTASSEATTMPVDNATTSLFPLSSGKEWNEFCNEFMSNRFTIKMTPCGDGDDRVVCHGSPYDNKMGSCSILNVAIDPVSFHTVMNEHRDDVAKSNALWLLWDTGVNPCPTHTFNGMDRYMVGGDYTKHVTKTAILSVPRGGCTEYVKGTSFLYMGFDYHIYFKFLSWFSLYNGIMNHWEEVQQMPSAIIRVPEGHGPFKFSEFEAPLFPEVLTTTSFDHLSSLGKGVMCFERVVLTPWAYSTNAFRCKMSDAKKKLRQRCYNCKGRNFTETRFATFRTRVLAACNLSDNDPKPANKSMVVILRRAYDRYSGDHVKKFSRVLENSDEIIASIRGAYPSVVVHAIYLEDIDLCMQIRLVHNCDVLLGVHGAGLVHLWWLRHEATVIEITPRSQKSNPSFKMLSTLVGKQYIGYTDVKGSEKFVKVDSLKIIDILKQYFL